MVLAGLSRTPAGGVCAGAGGVPKTNAFFPFLVFFAFSRTVCGTPESWADVYSGLGLPLSWLPQEIKGQVQAQACAILPGLVPYFLGLLQVWSQPILGSNLTLRGWSKALRWDRLGLPDCSTWTHWVRITICDFKFSSISDIFTV